MNSALPTAARLLRHPRPSARLARLAGKAALLSLLVAGTPVALTTLLKPAGAAPVSGRPPAASRTVHALVLPTAFGTRVYLNGAEVTDPGEKARLLNAAGEELRMFLRESEPLPRGEPPARPGRS